MSKLGFLRPYLNSPRFLSLLGGSLMALPASGATTASLGTPTPSNFRVATAYQPVNGKGRVLVAWGPGTNSFVSTNQIQGYILSLATNGQNYFTNIGTGLGTQGLLTNLATNVTYKIGVSEVVNNTPGPYAELNYQVPPPVSTNQYGIPAPANAQIYRTFIPINGQGKVTLAWEAGLNNYVTSTNMIDGYEIYWGGQSGNYTNHAGTGKVTRGQITGLKPNTQYYFGIRESVSGSAGPFAEVTYFVPAEPMIQPPRNFKIVQTNHPMDWDNFSTLTFQWEPGTNSLAGAGDITKYQLGFGKDSTNYTYIYDWNDTNVVTHLLVY